MKIDNFYYENKLNGLLLKYNTGEEQDINKYFMKNKFQFEQVYINHDISNDPKFDFSIMISFEFDTQEKINNIISRIRNNNKF